MNIFKKKDTLLDEQIELVNAKIRSVSFGTNEYAKWLDVRERLIKCKQEEETQGEINWELLLRVLEITMNAGIAVAGLILYVKIAALSYGLDEGMTLCNGRVFNMKDSIMKVIPKKV